ncbi:hypothetical protein BGZ70_003251 [Mortierella alpina]|uniref:Glycosyltransferase family 62 protein n=1 Tax=Mortierella alpina TaxID=64518 RepID=A0A9P6JAL9_MORAP|nr:hypothetical protein BGZ70_003251 [Mortierella alpina]
MQLRYLLLSAMAIYIFLWVSQLAGFRTSYHPKDTHFDFSSPLAAPLRDNDKPTVLVLTLVRNHEGWGKNRSFLDFIQLVQSLDYPPSNLHLGVLVSDPQEYDTLSKIVHQWDSQPFFPKVRILLRGKDVGIAREDRKQDHVQRERRRLIARLRNYLLYSTLQDEEAVLWIDSDVTHIPSDVLGRMVDSGKDIITTAATYGPGGGFLDLNAWSGERIQPNEEQMKVVEAGGVFVPGPSRVQFTHELSQEFGELDSVGGMVLFVRAEVHREGVAFTTNYVIGTGWHHEGYDGIETEGLCYVAKFLGYKCWGMPHAIAVHSTD